MSGPAGVPRHRTFQPTFEPTAPRRPDFHRRPTPRGRALLLALGTLAAPALAVLALTAFGSLSDEPDSGLGSLPAAEGLQGSTQATPPPQSGDGKPGAASKEDDDSEFASDDPSKPQRDGSRPARRPALADCPGDAGPRAETSKQQAGSSSRSAGATADCGGAKKPERTVDGDVKPGGGSPVIRPEEPQPTQSPSGGYEDDSEDSDGPGGSGHGGP